MTMNDTLASAMSAVMNAEKKSRTEAVIFPSSKIIKQVFSVMEKNDYIGKHNDVKDSKGTSIKIELLGRINNCGAIKPRFSLTLDEYEKFEKRFLPAKEFGILIVTTNKGVMTHIQAKEEKLGGKLLAYCY